MCVCVCVFSGDTNASKHMHTDTVTGLQINYLADAKFPRIWLITKITRYTSAGPAHKKSIPCWCFKMDKLAKIYRGKIQGRSQLR